MTRAANDKVAAGVQVEQRALDGLAERLALQFPDVPAEDIVRAIRGQYDGIVSSAVAAAALIDLDPSVRSDLTNKRLGHRA